MGNFVLLEASFPSRRSSDASNIQIDNQDASQTRPHLFQNVSAAVAGDRACSQPGWPTLRWVTILRRSKFNLPYSSGSVSFFITAWFPITYSSKNLKTSRGSSCIPTKLSRKVTRLCWEHSTNFALTRIPNKIQTSATEIPPGKIWAFKITTPGPTSAQEASFHCFVSCISQNTKELSLIKWSSLVWRKKIFGWPFLPLIWLLDWCHTCTWMRVRLCLQVITAFRQAEMNSNNSHSLTVRQSWLSSSYSPSVSSIYSMCGV